MFLTDTEGYAYEMVEALELIEQSSRTELKNLTDAEIALEAIGNVARAMLAKVNA